MWYGEEFDLSTTNLGTITTNKDFKNAKLLVRGELPEYEKRAGCTSDWKLQESEEDAATETRCYVSLMAVSYMAHLTSWKTVWIDIVQDYYDLGFWGSFEKHIGMEKHMKNVNSWPKTLQWKLNPLLKKMVNCFGLNY